MKFFKEITLAKLTLILLVIIFLKQTNFARKIYTFTKYNFNERFNKTYDYCIGSGTGYVNYLDKKYKFTGRPKILNYSTYPDPSWVIKNVNKKELRDQIILLNYREKILLDFKKINDNQFINNNKIYYTSGIEEITLINNNEIDKKLVAEIKFYKKDFKKNIEFFKTDIDDIFNKQLKLNLNKKILMHNESDVLITHRDIIIKINYDKNSQVKSLEKIKVSFINFIDLENYKILDNYNNCYLIEK